MTFIYHFEACTETTVSDSPTAIAAANGVCDGKAGTFDSTNANYGLTEITQTVDTTANGTVTCASVHDTTIGLICAFTDSGLDVTMAVYTTSVYETSMNPGTQTPIKTVCNDVTSQSEVCLEKLCYDAAGDSTNYTIVYDSSGAR